MMTLTDSDLALIRRHYPWFQYGKTAAQIVAEREARKKAEQEDPLYRSGLSAGRVEKEQAVVRQWKENYDAWRAAGNRPACVEVDQKLERRRRLTAERVRRYRERKVKTVGADGNGCNASGVIL